AFIEGGDFAGKNLSSLCGKLVSYGYFQLAVKDSEGNVLLRKWDKAPSQTTATQMNAVKVALSRAGVEYLETDRPGYTGEWEGER
ncbi:hypothetical protein, partial [Tepidimonas sp.]|uniref:hypothetical protein n=1 Tax=Tepidimonas sp. TaxID=2002775 RepID=UPI003919F6E1